MMKTYLLFIVVSLIFLAGCSTPEGTSSLPWSQPEPWEHEMPIGEDY